MTAEPMPRGALGDRREDLARVAELSDGDLVVSDAPFIAQVDLRLDPALAGRALYPLPLTPNTTWSDGQMSALWLGPDEWLIVGPEGAGPRIVAELEQVLEGVHRSIVDVGADRVMLEVRGPGRRTILSKGCSLDLHPRSWTEGMCAQTLLAKAQVILHERRDDTVMFVRPSFAGYLLDWFLAAAGA